jgi:hypothetical protein
VARTMALAPMANAARERLPKPTMNDAMSSILSPPAAHESHNGTSGRESGLVGEGAASDGQRLRARPGLVFKPPRFSQTGLVQAPEQLESRSRLIAVRDSDRLGRQPDNWNSNGARSHVS